MERELELTMSSSVCLSSGAAYEPGNSSVSVASIESGSELGSEVPEVYKEMPADTLDLWLYGDPTTCIDAVSQTELSWPPSAQFVEVGLKIRCVGRFDFRAFENAYLTPVRK